MIFSLLLGDICMNSENIYAGIYDNAYSFYSAYANRMIFVPTTATDGNIYYATRAKRTSSSILFSNIGWKATIQTENGTILQEVYYKMDGNYLKTTDIRTASDGYEYSLYAVSLKTFKSRLNESVRQALESGDCNVIFNACIIVKRNGIPGGGMSDTGINWGTVYTTYDGIVNAEDWSSVTRNALLSYYNKEVEELFYTLTLNKDNGIALVTGAGKYCYGTVVTFSAVPKAGYQFSHWSGDATSMVSKNSVVMTKNKTFYANSKVQSLMVTYYRNHNSEDSVLAMQMFTYGQEGQKLKDWNWIKTGYYQTGWRHNRSGLGTDYGKTDEVSIGWVNSHIPKLNLYAGWSPNRYTIVFDANGGETSGVGMQDKSTNYEGVFTLPDCAYTHPEASFLGWSLHADDITPQFHSAEEVTVEFLAKETGVENSDGALIVLYAIWDNLPAIEASDIYVSIKSAKEGKVTEEWLSSFATASDREDGDIPYGLHSHNSFILTDYDREAYTHASGECVIEETFSATDSSGNCVKRSIQVHLVDTTVYSKEELYGTVRFINMEYLIDEEGNLLPEEAGGLSEKSVWRREEALLELLKQVLRKTL